MSRQILRWRVVGGRVIASLLSHPDKQVCDITPQTQQGYASRYIARVYLDTLKTHSYFENIPKAKLWIAQRISREIVRIKRDELHGGAIVQTTIR